jgi:hypothetical protein
MSMCVSVFAGGCPCGVRVCVCECVWVSSCVWVCECV